MLNLALPSPRSFSKNRNLSSIRGDRLNLSWSTSRPMSSSFAKGMTSSRPSNEWLAQPTTPGPIWLPFAWTLVPPDQKGQAKNDE